MVKVVKTNYPEVDHIFIYDNATTHLKCAGNSLSAHHMPKNTPKPGKNWLVEIPEVGPDGKSFQNPDGSIKKIRVCMMDTVFNSQPQSLYYPEGHPCGGVFKGITIILEEQGYDIHGKKALCGGAKFNCLPGAQDCCCHWMLFNEPDFANVKSRLEELAENLGVQVIFLPKFHCELNPIEQCWGFAKRVYQLSPHSLCKDHLEHNALSALAEVPLTSIQKFAVKSHWFIDAYSWGLNGRQAAWAVRHYCGHCTLPMGTLEELGEASIY
ncbi:hypothetical protein P691DRAFT_798574 [Macrolepiota fuliginosa MF-IS2]|uniref:Uncharacterized protein n=1 Tax=Macrolepiota fuliginosa MF-IS2 TaxID=1400762 RepID=A0A9P5X2W6_9AGAR|nr:hypothetical protein P691DRAFT_798574 [Macrolepiota fuliginosa MF-IS2]